MVIENANDILEGLDEHQKTAASAILGPVAIIAGAGTGKTRTITHRIAYACRTGEWLACQVLAVTFTAKAAKEMRERLEQLGVNDATVNTFHATALRQLLNYWPKAVGSQAPKLETNKLVHVIDAAKYHQIELTKSEASAIADEIGWCKVSLIAPAEYEEIASLSDRIITAPVTPKSFVRIYDQYDIIKSERGLIDFEDVLLLMIHLISTRKQIADEIHQTYKHVIVDEFQDVSPLQYKLLECWLGKSRELCVVGDPSQTIYSFTGATPHYLQSFDHNFKPKYSSQPAPRKVNLINDYRSSNQIVKLANKILKYRGKESFEPLQLVSKAPETLKPIRWKVYPNDLAEAQNTVKQIQQLIQLYHDSSGKEGYDVSDIAILTRTNLQLEIFIDELRLRNIPYFIKLDSKKIREDDTDITSDNNGITLASLHSSKGLEWQCVFLCGLSDGQMPISRARDEYSIEEERRLLYVGVTRAKEQLVMSFSRAKGDNTRQTRMRSRFLDHIWPNN